MYPDRGDEAGAFLVAASYFGTEHAGRDHSRIAGRVEPAERERVSAGHDHAGVALRAQRQGRDDVVGHEYAHDVGVVRGVEVMRGKSVRLGLVAGRILAHAHQRRAAAVAQVECPRPALVAVSDHGDALVRDRVEICVVLVEDVRHSVPLAGPRFWDVRLRGGKGELRLSAPLGEESLEQLGLIRHAELAVDRTEVVADRAAAHVEPFADGL